MDTDHQSPDGENVARDSADVVTEERESGPELEYRQRRAEMLRGSMEHREFEVGGMECRALDDGTIRMTGIASVTERFYDVGDPKRGGFRERIARNAFRRTLSEKPDVVLLGNHVGWPLARTKNDSLSLAENARGLQWDADLDAEDPESKVIARKVDKGLVDQCSFAFLCTDDSWNDDYTERTIKGLSLHRGDVSIVTHGANEATSVSALRSADEALLEVRAGKTLSAKTRSELQEAHDKLGALLSESDKAEEESGPAEEALAAVDEQSADAERAEETDQEERKVVPIPIDYAKRQRERLAVLKGGHHR